MGELSVSKAQCTVPRSYMINVPMSVLYRCRPHIPGMPTVPLWSCSSVPCSPSNLSPSLSYAV